MTALAEQARSLYEQGRFADCERICRTMLGENPDDVDALSTLGYLALHGGMPDTAVKCFARASELEPRDPGHKGVLATALRQLGRHDEALAAQQASVDLAPRDPAALTNLAQQFAETGRFDDAIGTYEKAISLRPDLGKAHYGLALIKKFSADDARIPVLLQQFERDDLGDSDRIGIAFTLGRAFDDLHEFDRAFEYFELANELRNKASRYDPLLEKQHLQRMAKSFTPTLLAQNQGAGDDSDVPVFIIGMPRSGSTLVEQILDAHPDINGGGELPWAAQVLANILPRHLAAGQQMPEAVTEVPSAAWAEMGAAYLGKIRSLQNGAKHVVDKQLFNYMLVGPIHLMLPNARFVHCVRDSLDTCVSCYTQNFGGDHGLSCDLNHLGQAWRNYADVMAHWRNWLPEDQLFELNYEDLVQDPEGTTRALLDYLGLPWHAGCLDFADSGNAVVTSSLGQVRNSIYASSVGRWRRFEKHLKPLHTALKTEADDG